MGYPTVADPGDVLSWTWLIVSTLLLGVRLVFLFVKGASEF